ncbi:MAG TPA: hypothetical protein VN668_16165 [Stellaceae bacterium]|nr:hypothetical protein [Stellaceae bacterium]
MSAVAHLKYLVEKCSGFWTVSFGGRPNGEFATRGEACHNALKDGIRVGNLGHDVKIEAREPREQSGNIRTVWSSSR